MTELFIWLTIFSIQSPNILKVSRTNEVYCFNEKVSTLTLAELSEYKFNRLDAQKVCDIVNSFQERN